MMGDKGFIPRLKEYDKDNIPAKIMKTIRTTYMPNEKFNAESAAKASSAAAGLCKWVLAMECYDRVRTSVSVVLGCLRAIDASCPGRGDGVGATSRRRDAVDARVSFRAGRQSGGSQERGSRKNASRLGHYDGRAEQEEGFS